MRGVKCPFVTAIASHANVAVPNGRFTPLIVEMPYTYTGSDYDGINHRRD